MNDLASIKPSNLDNYMASPSQNPNSSSGPGGLGGSTWSAPRSASSFPPISADNLFGSSQMVWFSVVSLSHLISFLLQTPSSFPVNSGQNVLVTAFMSHDLLILFSFSQLSSGNQLLMGNQMNVRNAGQHTQMSGQLMSNSQFGIQTQGQFINQSNGMPKSASASPWNSLPPSPSTFPGNGSMNPLQSPYSYGPTVTVFNPASVLPSPGGVPLGSLGAMSSTS